MKSPSAFQLLSVAVAISLAASHPLLSESAASPHSKSEPVSSHLDSEKTSKDVNRGSASDLLSPTPQPKLPWMEPSKDSYRCGGYSGYVEIICGTKRFCNAYDEDRIETDQKYASSAECLTAREPPSTWVPPKIEPKRPWLPSKIHLSKCDMNQEECSGTWRYCVSFNTFLIRFSTQEFANADDCFAAHEPNPRTEKIPWLEEPPSSGVLCDQLVHSKRFCGTQRYYEMFDQEYELQDTLGNYKNSTKCFNDHEPGVSPASKGKKLRYDTSEPWAECDQDASLMACGTKAYCEAFDLGRRTDRKYPSTQKCFDAFQPPDDQIEGLRTSDID